MNGIDKARTHWFLRNVLPHESDLRRWLVKNPVLGIDPDDIIQEAYTILAELPSVEGIHHPRAYLFQVARSLIVRHIRRARIVSITAIDNLESLDRADDSATPEQLAIDRDELRRLAAAIAAMPTKTQEAFILRRVKGLSQRQIASEMEISENTVEKHISRGTRFLIKWFGDGGSARSHASRDVELEIASSDGRARNESRH